MEVFDRLLCAFAQDALDSFYLSTRGALDTLNNTRKSAVLRGRAASAAWNSGASPGSRVEKR